MTMESGRRPCGWHVRFRVLTRRRWERIRATTPGISSLTIRFARVTPHVAHNAGPRRHSAVDGRTTRHADYAQSINARKRIEQVFGWIKQAAGLRQFKTRGRSRVGAVFRLHLGLPEKALIACAAVDPTGFCR